jgi:nitrous oxide reductase accessory protein NosL
MGDDLVPLRTREVAERFARDHGGRVVSFAEVDQALLALLR